MNQHTPLFYTVKAFFFFFLSGNPAAIVVLDQPLAVEVMQRIAFINSFPETVFLRKITNTQKYEIFWFTPTHEVYDAGHATLAAQYTVFNILHPKENNACDSVEFSWRCGYKEVQRDHSSELIYDRQDIHYHSLQTKDTFGCEAVFEVDDDLVLVLKNSRDVKAYKPDMDFISNSQYRGLTVTSKDENYDYCCRFFAPKYGVAEDNVTATVHKYLVGFWAERLSRQVLQGVQYSKSPGIVTGRINGNTSVLSGDCCLYSEGRLTI
ncbi:MAG: PhzF family phenazine biosynthesis protein [Cellvibrionales bacterium]|nr:PhzF family phenazine biosynthesis protein [Cellvibrionales bacterium]